jgi:hypothetical protein
MNDIFARRVRAAAAAGWWTLLIVYIFMILQWFVYLYIIFYRPGWMLAVMGEGFTWQAYQSFYLWGIFTLKIGILLMAVVVVWLTIWGRILSRMK